MEAGADCSKSGVMVGRSRKSTGSSNELQFGPSTFGFSPTNCQIYRMFLDLDEITVRAQQKPCMILHIMPTEAFTVVQQCPEKPGLTVRVTNSPSV